MRQNNGASTSAEMAALKHIEELVTVIAKTLLFDRLAKIMEDPKQRMIYEASGRVSGKELAKRARVSFTTISGLWQKWERQGLMIKDGKSYRPIL